MSQPPVQRLQPLMRLDVEENFSSGTVYVSAASLTASTSTPGTLYSSGAIYHSARAGSALAPVTYVAPAEPFADDYLDTIIKSDTLAVVIPACNEAEQIESAIQSLKRQSRRPDRIIVVVNNSDDDTAQRAQAAGAEVIIMTSNPFKKAGALNSGVRYLLREGVCPEVVVTIDGDTELDEHCVQRAFNALRNDEQLGGLGVVCLGKEGLGRGAQRMLAWMQRVEYARAGYLRVRREAHTLPGAGSFIRGEAVLQILRDRGILFDQRPSNLVEDFELTLEIKRHGWRCRTNYWCVAKTDLMPTISGLLKQRTRWVRGTVDELRRRGWQRETRGSIALMWYGLFSLPVFYLWPVLAGYLMLQGGVRLWDFWILPFVSMYQALSVKRIGFLAAFGAALLVFDVAFALLRHYWFLKSIMQAFLGHRSRIDWSAGSE